MILKISKIYIDTIFSGALEVLGGGPWAFQMGSLHPW